MKKRDDLKKVVVRAAVFGMVLLSLAGSSFCQSTESGYEYDLGFISREYRPRWYQSYENYGQYDLRKYPTYYQEQATGRQYLSPVTYDQFGNFLLPGGDIYYMKWDRSRIGASYDADTATGETNYFNSVFNNLMISSDEFSNWQTKFMIGTTLRAHFTSSTLKDTRLNGIRWDASSRKNNVTLIASPGTNPLWGVHWQSILGDILRVGGTFVSKQRGTISNSHQDIDTAIKTGPRYVYLFFSDDSPEDTDRGARVYDVKIKESGQAIDVPTRVFKIPDLLNSKRYYDKDFQKQYVFQRSSSDPFIPQKLENIVPNTDSWVLGIINTTTNINDLLSKTSAINYYGYLNLPDPGSSDPNSRLFAADKSKGFLEANGTDVVVYEFLVPYAARDLEFSVLAANDYCIDIIAAMYNVTQSGEADWNNAPFSPAWSGNWSVKYDTKQGAKAPGNVKDLSNMGWVPVRYDRMTGMSVYGLDMELNWRGLFVRAEFNEYNAYRSYPVPASWTEGKKGKETSRAWFINAEKDFGRWSVGGEVFDYPYEYMKESSPGSMWSTVDDNDDNDQNSNTGGYEYPGMDVDFDRYVDTTWSGQPYILYYFDSVSFGDDFNHNSIIDERENDDQVDLPYERDSKGQHYFLKIRPRELTLLSLGHYNIEQTYLEGRNLTDYVKFEHTQRLATWMELGVFHRTERVHDTYRSGQYYRQYWGPTGYFNNLAYKNAWSNSSMLHTRLTLIPDLNIINDIKYDVINRVGDLSIFGTEDQNRRRAPRDITDFSSVNKVDYTYRIADARVFPDIYWRGYRLIKEKRIKEFKLQPMFKFVYSQFTRDLQFSVNSGHSYNIYPILRFDYRVAPNTLLRCGFQGFPFFPEISRNTGNDLNDVNRRRMILAFENRSLYQGFNLLVMLGIRRDKSTWVESYGRKQPGTTEYFITIRSEASK